MFELDVIKIVDFQPTLIEKKIFYNNDGRDSVNKWLKSKINNSNITFVPTKNGFDISNTKGVKDKMMDGAIGYFYNNSNCVQYNTQGVALFSTVFGSAHGIEIMNDNFFNIIQMYVARQLIKGNWVNEKDEYLVPKEINEDFIKNSIILSLFGNGSYQTSLRNINYNGNDMSIKNQFFWMSKEDMMNLANQNNYTELYNDSRTDSERYVHNLLFGEQRIYDQLSTEAKDVLDTATELVRLSIGMRRNFADDTNHLNSWDAGYAQLKLLWKEYFPEQFKEFRNKYKVLEDKMRPMVYELGFLMK